MLLTAFAFDSEWGRLLMPLHQSVGLLLFMLAAGHIVMVVIHQVRKHDALTRMPG